VDRIVHTANDIFIKEQVCSYLNLGSVVIDIMPLCLLHELVRLILVKL